ncbi:unnamed protein product [Vicia faba]|uniref:DNA-directed RNA polymerase n=1 Tax=Vicia faba TaxID=3906 RepID=A0AAV1A4F5_VICFA|nr:unnamed protein product [Vicia faba]
MLGVGNEGMSTLPGLNQIQFEGFCRFIDRGLTEELLKFPKIEDTDQEIEFQLFAETYQIVINQILQSPDIYYRSELDHNGISVYTGTIISDWGGRLELEIDRKARIWARVSRKQKISILVLSSAMGSNLSETLENVCYPEIFLSFLNEKEGKK